MKLSNWIYCFLKPIYKEWFACYHISDSLPFFFFFHIFTQSCRFVHINQVTCMDKSSANRWKYVVTFLFSYLERTTQWSVSQETPEKILRTTFQDTFWLSFSLRLIQILTVALANLLLNMFRLKQKNCCLSLNMFSKRFTNAITSTCIYS